MPQHDKHTPSKNEEIEDRECYRERFQWQADYCQHQAD